MSGQRLRLTTSRPAGYRRGGQVIGGAAAPTFVKKGDLDLDQALAIFRDQNVAVAIEDDNGAFKTLSSDERDAVVEELAEAIEADRAAQQTDLGTTPDPAALDAVDETADDTPPTGGPKATADASTQAADASAAGAGTTAAAQADVEPPAAKPSGRNAAKRSGGKPAKTGT